MLHLQAEMGAEAEAEAFEEMLRSLEQLAHLRILSLAWAMQVCSDAMQNRLSGVVYADAAWQACSHGSAC